MKFGQLVAFIWIYFAYVCCYLVRKNYPLLLPDLKAEGLLSTEEAGIVASVFEAVVGTVKFFGGVFVDRASSPAYLLAQTLITAGFSCLGMQATFWAASRGTNVWKPTRVLFVAIFWSLNGAGQAIAWPALARVFMDWFPDPATRGTWYSLLATNQNLGGVLAPRLYPPLIDAYGWEVALWPPAVLTLMYGIVMSVSLKSKPANAEVTEGKVKKDANAKKVGFVETFTHLLSEPPFVCLCVAYIPIMMIRISFTNWTAIIFQERQLSLNNAAACMSALEIGGFIGGLTGGVVSDTMFNGARGPVMCIFSLVCCPLSLLIRACLMLEATKVDLFALLSEALLLPVQNFGLVNLDKMIVLQILFFFLGLASFPPHSLIGLTSREISPVNMRSTAGCLAKAIGQIGAAAAGWPLEQVAQVYGWQSVGIVNAFCGLLAALIFLPLWGLKGKAKSG